MTSQGQPYLCSVLRTVWTCRQIHLCLRDSLSRNRYPIPCQPASHWALPCHELTWSCEQSLSSTLNSHFHPSQKGQGWFSHRNILMVFPLHYPSKQDRLVLFFIFVSLSHSLQCFSVSPPWRIPFWLPPNSHFYFYYIRQSNENTKQILTLCF